MLIRLGGWGEEMGPVFFCFFLVIVMFSLLGGGEGYS